MMDHEVKQKIAKVVRSVSYMTHTVGGDCLFRALCGQTALSVIGHKPDLMFGGMLYQAGPGEINVLSMGGPGGIGMIQQMGEDQMLCGHVWLILDTEDGRDLIDFSSGDWHRQSDQSSAAYEDDLPMIDWQVEPPAFLWEPLDKVYVRKPLMDWDELRIGEPSYRPFRGDHSQMLRDMLPVMTRHLRNAAGPLFNTVKHHAHKLI